MSAAFRRRLRFKRVRVHSYSPEAWRGRQMRAVIGSYARR